MFVSYFMSVETDQLVLVEVDHHTLINMHISLVCLLSAMVALSDAIEGGKLKPHAPYAQEYFVVLFLSSRYKSFFTDT